ncbi:sulfurtransferase [Corticibacter populi]|uniref:Sulfurtransferase n=1 Tax=Corticibacter populi TaxID=1550736 RepID=A0A3M6QTM7_9BURK|nr:sulfurtransferase [Corticibacter populi]RMX06384.1 sulfurtransferase [Corticibacter populi]RZS32070.1 thiosulfate/3-mercaptopyruvate sulfurtransferase [Corticibacter populi]
MPSPVSPVLSCQELAEWQAHGVARRLVLVDCRHELADPAWGRQAYRQGRIPGAIFLSLDDDLSAAPDGRNGRHPLPTPQAFAQTLARAGIGNDSHVVAYDQGVGMFAARLWWMLRWLGHTAVQVLDGGSAQWQREARPIEIGTPKAPAPAHFVPDVQTGMLRDAGTVLQALGDGRQYLLDARAPERFRGEVEPLDRVAGHIPGAVNRPFTDNLEAGLFKPAGQLRSEFEALLAGRASGQVIHQCGSGVSACVNLLAMERAGLSGSALYAGSWSEWCSDPARPVAVGA